MIFNGLLHQEGRKNMKKIEFVVAVFVPLFFMTSCSKKTPEKAEIQVSSEDIKRETGEALETKSSDAWEDVKSGMDAALENLKNSYNDAVSHFK